MGEQAAAGTFFLVEAGNGSYRLHLENCILKKKRHLKRREKINFIEKDSFKKEETMRRNEAARPVR